MPVPVVGGLGGKTPDAEPIGMAVELFCHVAEEDPTNAKATKAAAVYILKVRRRITDEIE